MKKHKKILRTKLIKACKDCNTGFCCQDGVDVDLKEAQRISRFNLKLAGPWFENSFRASYVPSGWAVSTKLRNGRCIFQQENYRCVIYKNRPRFCRDFPFENGRLARYYHYLCEKPPAFKRHIKRHFKRYFPDLN